MKHWEQILVFLIALLLSPVIFLVFWPLMLYVRLAPSRCGVTIGLVVSNRWTDLLQYMRLPYDWALFRAGARVVTIAPHHHQQLESRLAQVDGLVLTGGEDIHPSFHKTNALVLSEVNEARDKLELDIFKLADEQKIPYLCVCRGAQLMAVQAGGRIESYPHGDQRIDKHVSKLVKFAEHNIKTTDNSLLAKLLDSKKTRVNSFHHILIRDAGQCVATAYADDDAIEALEKPGDVFSIGVQWHPEFMAPFNPAQQNLFSALVEFCRKNSQQ